MNDHSPFPGLRPFRSGDYHLFTGREDLRNSALDKLGENRFLAVLGPAGCGKTSIVEAGLANLAILNALSSDAPGEWKVAYIRPGKGEPLRMLAEELVQISNDVHEYAIPNARIQISTESSARKNLEQRLNQIEDSQRFNVLLVVDPFENLFCLAEPKPKPDEVAAFIERLVDLSELDTKIKMFVVIVLRVEFLDQCFPFTRLFEAIGRSFVLVPRLSYEQCINAIKHAANKCDADLHQDLVEQLKRDLVGSGCNLPLLQHAMMRTWAAWEKARVAGPQSTEVPAGARPEITAEYYPGLNGLASSLSECADRALNELGGQETENDRVRYERVAKRLFSALGRQVKFSVETKLPVKLDQLWKGLLSDFEDEPDHVRSTLERRVLDLMNKFREPGLRLILPSRDDLERELTVDDLKSDLITLELGHTCMIRHWERLKRWVDEPADRYHVLFSYNSEEKEDVVKIWQRLASEGIKVWIDEDALQPGDPLWDRIEEEIGRAETIAVFHGQGGAGPYQKVEVRTSITNAINRGCRVIPVILPSFKGSPKDLPPFMSTLLCVDFRSSSPDPYKRLVKGITGSKGAKRV